MTITLKKYGTILSGRPAGREAYLIAKAYALPKDTEETIDINFDGVEVFAPSWADEFITPMMREYPGKVTLLPSENASVKATLETIL